eukprot:13387995-Alexandrium_andersonii.AAC.1
MRTEAGRRDYGRDGPHWLPHASAAATLDALAEGSSTSRYHLAEAHRRGVLRLASSAKYETVLCRLCLPKPLHAG